MITLLGTAARLAGVEAGLSALEDSASLVAAGASRKVRSGGVQLPVIVEANEISTTYTLNYGVAPTGSIVTVASVTGKGLLDWASIQRDLSSTDYLRLILELDGANVFDETYSNASSSPRYLVGCGNFITSTKQIIFGAMPFRSSMIIRAATSASTATVVRYSYRSGR